jgi:hypothetical protein
MASDWLHSAQMSEYNKFTVCEHVLSLIIILTRKTRAHGATHEKVGFKVKRLRLIRAG